MSQKRADISKNEMPTPLGVIGFRRYLRFALSAWTAMTALRLRLGIFPFYMTS